MALTKLTLVILVTFIFVSVLVARIQDVIYVRETDELKFEQIEDDGIHPDDSHRRLLYFVQVTDTHFSIFHDPSRLSEFRLFIKEIIMQVIKPPIVLMTGDIVDSVTPDLFGSRQYKQEWEMYWQVIYDTGVSKKHVWLDIRGNHDNLNLASPNNENNYYRKYSVQGQKYPHSYSYTYRSGEETYTFIAIDTCFDPGAKRPFNFLGKVDVDQYIELMKMKEKAKAGNGTIWFGHHPTSSIISADPGVRELMRGSGPYLCGHYHTIGGLVHRMYTLHHTGSLELELSDWKKQRKYRIMAIDHGIYSFVDVKPFKWPVILITNPKDALFIMPSVEPLHRIHLSSHVRVLVFSVGKITNVECKIDSEPWLNMSLVKEPLYVVKWQPSRYAKEVHKIYIRAEDDLGNALEVEQDFSLDGTRTQFSPLARFVLMAHLSIFQSVVGFLVCVSIVPLCILKTLHHLGKDRQIRIAKGCCSKFIFKLYLLATVDKLFWPIIIFPLYVAVGPWFIGEIVEDHVGVCFLWGMFVYDTFIHSGMIYLFCIVFFITFYIPYTICLALTLHYHYIALQKNVATPQNFLPYLCRHFIMICLILWQTLWAMMYFLAYGFLAFFLGFVNTGAVILSLTLWRLAVTLPKEQLMENGVKKAISSSSSASVESQTKNTSNNLQIQEEKE